MDEPVEVSGFPSGWYVAFHGTELRYWWDWFCRPGFRHCLAFAYAAHAERWIVHEVTRDRTLVCAFTSEAFQGWIERLPPERRIVYYEAPANPGPPPRLGFWCVPATAHLVGLATRALRPEAFWRDLMAHGARPAFEPDPSTC